MHHRYRKVKVVVQKLADVLLTTVFCWCLYCVLFYRNQFHVTWEQKSPASKRVSRVITGQGCRARSNVAQSGSIEHFLGHINCTDLESPVIQPYWEEAGGKDWTVSSHAHWRPKREHPAVANGAHCLVYSKDTAPHSFQAITFPNRVANKILSF